LSHAVLLPRPFWFLRHGETDWNAANLTQGRTDVPLNEHGIAQAHAAAARLTGQGITSLFCSPLGRARHTADIVAGRLGLPVQIHNDLREASYGVHEGEVMGAWFAAWVAGDASPERGESFAQVGTRAVAAINTITTENTLPLIIGHGGFFRTVRAAMGFPAAVRTPNAQPLFCKPHENGWEMDALDGPPIYAEK